MNKLVDRQVEFTLNKKNEYIKNIFKLELISPFITILLSLYFSLLINPIFGLLFLSLFSFFTLNYPNKQENISNLPFYFSQLNIISIFFIKRYFKKQLDLDFQKYNKHNKNEVFFFYNDLELINHRNYKEALSYWSKINTISNSLKIKQFATDKIKLLHSHIQSINYKISIYNSEQEEIQKILLDENIIKSKKENKLKILSI